MSDGRVVRELYDGDPAAIARINKEYLVPRANALKGKQDIDRKHFLEPQGAASVGETERMMVQAKLKGLGQDKTVKVGISVAAAFCGLSESDFARRYRSTDIGGLSALESAAMSGIANEELKATIVLANMKKLKKLNLASVAQVAKAQKVVDQLAKIAEAKKARNVMAGKIPKASSGNRGWRWFRMDAVVKLSETPSPSKKTKKAAPAVVSTPAASMGIPLTVMSANYVSRGWVFDGEGRAVCNVAFNSLSPTALYGFLVNGGSIRHMSIRKAIEHEWASVSERKEWVDGYLLLLKREEDAVEVATKKHNANVEERALEIGLPAGRPAGSRPHL